MKSFHSVNLGRGGKLDIRGRRNAVLPLMLLALSIAVAKPALGQVKESAEVGGVMLSAGGSFSGYYVGYGQRELLGPTAFVDATPTALRAPPLCVHVPVTAPALRAQAARARPASLIKRENSRPISS